MNRITKKSSKEQDYEILKLATDNYVKAYCHSKRTLSGCAMGQSHRGFNSAINNEMKLSARLTRVRIQLEQKYGFSQKGLGDIVLIPNVFAQQFKVQGVFQQVVFQ